MQLSGKAAAMGQGIINDVSARIVETFSQNLAAMLSERPGELAEARQPPRPRRASRRRAAARPRRARLRRHPQRRSPRRRATRSRSGR